MDDPRRRTGVVHPGRRDGDLRAITNWLRDLTGEGFTELVAEAAEVPPGSGGLLLLPYFAGERTPLFDPDARGVLAGLTTGHTRGEVYRAALEGIAHGVRHNLEVMRSAGGGTKRLVAVGGGVQGGLWTRIVTDVTGVPQDVPEQTVGAALGDAWLAAVATGAEPRLRDWNPVARTIEPDPAAREVYDRFHPHYRSLYTATRETAHFSPTSGDAPTGRDTLFTPARLPRGTPTTTLCG